MDYTQIKQRAREKAERMHEEWLAEHFDGYLKPEAETESRDEDVGEREVTYSLRKKLVLGEFMPEEVEDGLAALLYHALKDKTFAEWRSPANILNEPAPAMLVEPSKRAEKFTELIDDFIADKRAAKGSIRETSIQAYRDSVALFVDVLGDLSVVDYTYQLGTKFRDTLTKIPPRRKTTKVYRDKTIAEIVDMDLPREKCMSSKYIFDVLSHIKGYFKWLKACRVISDNPIESVTIEKNINSYKAYTKEDLSRIFNSPLYSKDDPYLTRHARRSYWWLIAIAAFTGARISEIVQLHLNDVQEVDGTLCFSLIDEEETKRLKTDASRRIVPVHSVLKQAGLEDYIAEVRRIGEERLLPGTPYGERTPGQAAGNWYRERYRDVYFPELGKQHKVFHSFRHTFIQEAMRQDADLTKLQRLVGHEPVLLKATKNYDGEGMGAVTPKQLLAQMELVKFEDVDVRRLVAGGWREISRG